MNGDYCEYHCCQPLSHVRHRIGYVPGIKVGSGGGKENVLDSENFHTKDILSLHC